MIYVLICISLSFVGIAGLQFLYLAYLERVELEHKKKIRQLERHCKNLSQKLQAAEFQIVKQSKLIEEIYENEEVWAEVIEDR